MATVAGGHVHLDALGGVAGDMFVAAMLDAMPELRSRVFSDLAAIRPEGCDEPVLTEGLSGGIAAFRFGPADHDSPRIAPEAHGHHHGTRFSELARRIQSASLHPGTAEQAIGILRCLAQSESRMHRVPLEDVHFHEVGDWDSLLDVVAAGSIVAALASFTWSVSDLPRGHGQVRTQHGLLPVPAPATADLLRGFRWRDDGVGGERVTPTGAAILVQLGCEITPPSSTRVLQAVGTGAGTRELAGMPNILRALVFSATEKRPAIDARQDDVIVLSFDVDDMTGEEVGIAAERLRGAEGVLDVSLGSRQGKKGRPVQDFRLLIKPDALAAISERCFHETSTLGLRWRREQRSCLARSVESVVVDGRPLARKRALRPGGQASSKVESDDVARFDGLIERRRMKALGEQGEEGA